MFRSLRLDDLCAAIAGILAIGLGPRHQRSTQLHRVLPGDEKWKKVMALNSWCGSAGRDGRICTIACSLARSAVGCYLLNGFYFLRIDQPGFALSCLMELKMQRRPVSFPFHQSTRRYLFPLSLIIPAKIAFMIFKGLGTIRGSENSSQMPSAQFLSNPSKG